MEILRYAAFSSDPAGGNPAGVVLDAGDLDDADMQRIAADVGFSETAFLTPTGPTTARVRYFAPIAEVPFCGHATIASAVARAERVGAGRLHPGFADRPDRGHHVADRRRHRRHPGQRAAAGHRAGPGGHGRALLAALRLTEDDLDPDLPIRVSYSGQPSPDRRRAAGGPGPLDHDQQELTPLMAAAGLGGNGRGRRPDRRRRSSRRATRSRPAGCGRTRQPGRRPPRLAGICGRSAWSAAGAGHRAPGPARRPTGLLTVDIPAGDGGIAVSGRAVPSPIAADAGSHGLRPTALIRRPAHCSPRPACAPAASCPAPPAAARTGRGPCAPSTG